MATITTRAGKGSPLTNTEVDDNFSNLNSAKYESGSNVSFGTLSSGVQVIQGDFENDYAVKFDNTKGTGAEWGWRSHGVNGERFAFYDVSSGEQYMAFSNSSVEGVIFNENSLDQDFRVESNDSSHMLFVDGGNNHLGIGESAPSELIHATQNGGDAVLLLENTGSSATDDANIQLKTTNGTFTIQNDRSIGTSGALTLAGNTSNNIVIDHDTGNIGIGESEPEANLHVKNASAGTFSASNAQVLIENNTTVRLTMVSPNTNGCQIEFGDVDDQDVGKINYDHTNNYFQFTAGAQPNMAVIGYQGTVFNQNSYDADFRVESNDNANMLFVDAGNNTVGIGTTASVDETLTVAGEIRASGNDGAVRVDSGSGGYYLNLTQTYAHPYSNSYIQSVAGSSYHGRLIFEGNTNGGGMEEFLRMSTAEGVIFNEDGIDKDFRVESDSDAHAIFVDASTSRVGIMNNNPAYTFSVAGKIQASQSVRVDSNAGGESLITAKHNGNSSDFLQTRDSSNNLIHALLANGGAIFNENSEGTADFRVESDGNSHMLFVDAGLNQIGIAEPPIDSTYSTAPLVVQARTKYVDNTMYALQLNSSVYSDTNEFTTMLGFAVEDSGWSKGAIGFTRTASYDTGYLGFYVVNGGSQANAALSDEVLRLTGAEVVVNDRSRPHLDFRVESDSYSHAIYVDSSSNNILFGRSSHSWTANNFHIASPVNGGISVTANGDWGLQMAGQRAERIRFFSSAGGSVTVGNVSVSTTGTTYSTTSDRRLKENIQTITDATDKLMAMNPVEHTWKADPEADAVHGFIAQEMLEIVPEAVSGEPEGDEMMSMDYGRITPVLVAALQDAHKKIAELETRLNELEGQ